jgi:hypothetical protein
MVVVSMEIPISLSLVDLSAALLRDIPRVTNFLMSLQLHQVATDLLAVLARSRARMILAMMVDVLTFGLEGLATALLDYVIVLVVLSVLVSLHAVLIVVDLVTELAFEDLVRVLSVAAIIMQI